MTWPFLGHTAPLASFLTSFQSKRPPHAWLVEGPQGIGKASFAERLSAQILSHPDKIEDPDFLNFLPLDEILSQMNSKALPNFLRIDLESSPLQSISIDQVRSITQFMIQTTEENQWRIVIVDSLNDLNRNAAPALLKVLEEPAPRTLFFLIAHAGGNILPTLRSRCASLKFKPLLPQEIESLGHNSLLSSLAQGSPGRLKFLEETESLTFLNTIIELIDQILVSPLPNYTPVYKFMSSLQTQRMKFETFTLLLLWWTHRILQWKSTQDLGGFHLEKEEGILKILNKIPLHKIDEVFQEIFDLVNLEKTLHPDLRHLILTIFFKIESLRNS